MQGKLLKYGYIYTVSAGFQFDLNSVLKKTFHGFAEGHFCDHNCTTDCGNYDCPAAFSRNKNILPQTLMTLENIKRSLQTVKNGMILANAVFLKKLLPLHAKNFRLPKNIEKEIEKNLAKNQLEINLFGGNPELHPHFLEIIKSAHQLGWKVTTTTTGKKFLHDEKFVEGFLRHPPDLLAISADDYESIDELKRLLTMSLSQLKMYWQKANPLYGQRKKAYESIYVARLAQTEKRFCPVLLNIVVHPGNIHHIDQMLEIFHSHFPHVKLNPYPAQASFSHGLVEWTKPELLLLEKFIDFMIAAQLKNLSYYVSRLPYWLTLKSVFLATKDFKKRCYFLSGNEVWQCYRSPTAGKYFQAASANQTKTEIFSPGGHPGCFWNNETVTDAKQQIWKISAEKIKKYLLTEKVQLAKKAIRPCPGCLMPRLMFDGLSIEAGLNPQLIPYYLTLRKKYFRF